MVFTYFIYLLTLFLSVLLAHLGIRMENKRVGSLFFVASALVIIIISGFRDTTVGIDNEFYAEWFNDLDITKGLYENIIANIIDYEPGFVILNHTISALGLGYTAASLIYAIIIWTFIYKSFSRFPEILYLGVFFLITTGFLFFTFNGIRQAIAVSLVFYSLPFCIEKKYLRFSVIILLASLFHFSALMLFSLLLIRKLKKLNPSFWLFLMVTTTLLPGRLFYSIVFKVASILPVYAGYFERILQDSGGFSVGVIYQMGLSFILLYYYKNIADAPAKIMIFQLALIGAVLYNLFYGSPLLSRFYVYFLFFQNYAFSFVIDRLSRSGKRLEAVLLASTFILIFVYRVFVSESGSSPYSFGLH